MLCVSHHLRQSGSGAACNNIEEDKFHINLDAEHSDVSQWASG